MGPDRQKSNLWDYFLNEKTRKEAILSPVILSEFLLFAILRNEIESLNSLTLVASHKAIALTVSPNVDDIISAGSNYRFDTFE